MLEIYFGNDTKLNQEIRARLETYKLDYQEHVSNELDYQTLLFLFSLATDMFDLLLPKFLRYKLDNSMPMSRFIEKILSDVDNSLKFPIVITDKKEIYSGITPEEVATFLPKEYRKVERSFLFGRLRELDAAYTFWKNFDSFRKQSELRWFELNELLFADVSNDLGEVKKTRDRFFLYKKKKQIPPEEWIDKAARIFLVDKEDFFRSPVSDSRNYC
ncbi:thioredoxin domain-containing protein [Streptococcus anginosus]|uniref:hypothetical protein n=1 Tax=Streptococcus anginosus TaxID=1328 RepID=UPI00398CF34A